MAFYNPPNRKITTIEQHIVDDQRSFPQATGALTRLLYDVALAGKVIAAQTTRAGLVDILGHAGEINVQGEAVMKLDILADQTIYMLTARSGMLACLVSEEHEGILPIPEGYPAGKYVLLYDPLDGSSNIDFNVSIGTIFAIHRRKSLEGQGAGPGAGATQAGGIEDCLQPGRDLVAAGYIVYSASTMMVYSSGHGVHGFTLDPNIGEFLLSHHDIRIPAARRVLQRRSRAREPLEQGGEAFHPLSPDRRAASSRSATSARWSPIFTAPCSPAGFIITPPSITTRCARRVSCGCCMKPRLLLSSLSRLAVMLLMAGSASWISSQLLCIKGPRYSSAIASWLNKPKNSFRSMINLSQPISF